jgi:hypothetical protein
VPLLQTFVLRVGRCKISCFKSDIDHGIGERDRTETLSGSAAPRAQESVTHQRNGGVLG